MDKPITEKPPPSLDNIDEVTIAAANCDTTPFSDDWDMVQTLGEGAFGEVRLLINKRSKLTLAVKIIDLSIKDTNETARKEVLILSMLKHRNIIGYVGQRREARLHYIFLEYASGGELFDRIDPDVGMPDIAALYYFEQLIAGMAYIHCRGIAHRDIKPENLLLTQHDVLKISDFGMATVFRFRGQERMLTRCCGSLPYAAPEVLNVKRYRAEGADLWSCGIVLVALLAGELPWDEPNAERCSRYAKWLANEQEKSNEQLLVIASDNCRSAIETNNNHNDLICDALDEPIQESSANDQIDETTDRIVDDVTLDEPSYETASCRFTERIINETNNGSVVETNTSTIDQPATDEAATVLDCRCITPWSKMEDPAYDLVSKILACDPKKRATLHQIQSHPWFKGETLMACDVVRRPLNDSSPLSRRRRLVETSSLSSLERLTPPSSQPIVSTTNRSRCCQRQLRTTSPSSMSSTTATSRSDNDGDDVHGGNFQFVRPIDPPIDVDNATTTPPSVDVTKYKTTPNRHTNDNDDNDEEDVCFVPQRLVFSQPATFDNMLICTQSQTSDNDSQMTLSPLNAMQRLVKRMTRFFVNVSAHQALLQIEYYLSDVGFCTKFTSSTQLTCHATDSRRNTLIFKATAYTTCDHGILIDFRLSKGDGLDFKRIFVRLRDRLSSIIDGQGLVKTWSLSSMVEIKSRAVNVDEEKKFSKSFSTADDIANNTTSLKGNDESSLANLRHEKSDKNFSNNSDNDNSNCSSIKRRKTSSISFLSVQALQLNEK